ncbi:RNA polymerase sigma factor [Maribacter sp. 2-571]|uniref:RNA polymerase sigma factor n=1 Tax=Maribacter sp. 2-571 TaxID=3417569 RepID=UPI003D3483E5
MFQIDLVARCKQNDRKAQLKLYRQYCDGMFIVAMRFLKNENDAEDVLQEAFIKAFSKIDQYKGEVSFGAWLKRIVVNGSIDFLKSKKEQTVPMEEHFAVVGDEDDWSVSDSVTAEMARKAIARLPDTYRFVTQLFLVEGYDHSEISEILGISGSACRTRLLRGKEQLRLLLKTH